MIETIIEGVIIKIWFLIPLVVVAAALLVYMVQRKFKTDLLALSSLLCMVFILWSIISLIMWRDQAKIPALREKYRSQVKTERVDENGDLWIVIEAEDGDDVYSIDRGDDILRLVDEGVTLDDYPIGEGECPKTQYYWRYQVVGAGECDLYKVRRNPYSWKTDEVVAYRIFVDEDGNITKTMNYGEIPGWLNADDIEWHDYTDEAYDFFAKNVIFLYGENHYCEEPEMMGELYFVHKGNDSSGRWPETLYVCPDFRTIYWYNKKENDTTVWKEFRISDSCDISWMEEWAEKYYSN